MVTVGWVMDFWDLGHMLDQIFVRYDDGFGVPQVNVADDVRSSENIIKRRLPFLLVEQSLPLRSRKRSIGCLCDVQRFI